MNRRISGWRLFRLCWHIITVPTTPARRQQFGQASRAQGRQLSAVPHGDNRATAPVFPAAGKDEQDVGRSTTCGSACPPGRRRPQGQTVAASMPDSAESCGCNGVCKGTIVKAIQEQGPFTLEDVRKHTKASSSCGSRVTGLCRADSRLDRRRRLPGPTPNNRLV